MLMLFCVQWHELKQLTVKYFCIFDIIQPKYCYSETLLLQFLFKYIIKRKKLDFFSEFNSSTLLTAVVLYFPPEHLVILLNKYCSFPDHIRLS